jgi:proteasome-associated ATPase
METPNQDSGRTPAEQSAANDLSVADRQVNILRDKLRHIDRQLAAATQNNTKLVTMLESAKAEILRLKNALDQEGQPPYSFGTILQLNPKRQPSPGASGQAATEESVDIFNAGRKMRVGISPLVNINQLAVGQEVLLNEALLVVAGLGYERAGELATLKEMLGPDRALVVGRADEERVIRLSGALLSEKLRVGDALSIDSRTGYALEKVPRSEVENLVLEEVPDITYEDIGGLGPQIEQIRDAVELPFLHPDLYREHGLKAPKGILLYGPPGCG